MRRPVALLALTALLLLALAVPAGAHATMSPEEAASGSYTKLTFRVPHGCDGAPTNVVRISIPDGVVSVKPQVHPLWQLSTEIGALAEPFENHGETITEGVRTITYSGGNLSDAHLDEFGVSVKLPEGEEGDVLYFPVVQECEGGGEEAWIQIPRDPESDEELDHPAPAITLAAADGDGHGDSAEEEAEGSDAGAEAAQVTAAADLASAQLPAERVDVASEPLVLASFGMGLLGLLAGGAALVIARRR